MQLPKSLEKYRDRIADYSDEREGNNNKGIWVYYKSGWKSFSDPIGCLHQDHEDTIKEIADCVRSSQPCDCTDCAADAAHMKGGRI